ncbi:MAG: DUF4476 domain-containing protein [Chitinophagaceae bacterium]|nr:DUF4476 domain-containing protein [Chitinophagaceae bacterium]
MKTIFTLLTSLFMSIAVFAAGAKPKSMLTILSVDNSDIRVVIDGRRFEPGDNSLLIRQLDAGVHQVKVYRQKNSGSFSIFGKRYEMVYNTSLMVRPKTHVRLSIDRFGRTRIDERRIGGSYRDDRGRNDRDNDWGKNRDFDRDRDKDWDDDQSYDFDRDGRMGDYDTNYGYERAMDNREFSILLQSIDKEWLETNKLKSATQIVRTNNLTSLQVKQLVHLFGFEGNKLELAKQAYQSTVDKKNYFMVQDELSFSSSKEELNRYIRNFR